jgi:hypothetical protein
VFIKINVAGAYADSSWDDDEFYDVTITTRVHNNDPCKIESNVRRLIDDGVYEEKLSCSNKYSLQYPFENTFNNKTYWCNLNTNCFVDIINVNIQLITKEDFEISLRLSQKNNK